MVLTGCDSSGSNGGGDNGGGDALNNNIDGTYPAPSSGKGYAEEIAINIQSADLGIRLEGSNPNAGTLEDIYKGNQSAVSSEDIQLLPGADEITAPSATTYGELPSSSFADISSDISGDDLLKSGDLQRTGSAPDAPQSAGTPVNANELISYYLYDNSNGSAGWPKATTSNGVDMSQLSEKGVAGALTYAEGAAILNDFAEDGNVSGDVEEKWNEAFGHFGAPRDFGAFVDLDASGGLSSGSFVDANDDSETDLMTEGVYIWAGYTAERAAAAEANTPNDFAARAFNAFVDGREAIDNDNLPTKSKLSGINGDAEEALDAWEETVAVNVIHYVNGMQGALGTFSGEITETKIDNNFDDETSGFEDSWGEAKAFVWALQFNETGELSDSELQTIHDKIGNDPPYSEGVDASTYNTDLAEVKQTIQETYGFSEANVQAW
jgi:hypothetical protein